MPRAPRAAELCAGMQAMASARDTAYDAHLAMWPDGTPGRELAGGYEGE
jgi:hypothetical protein